MDKKHLHLTIREKTKEMLRQKAKEMGVSMSVYIDLMVNPTTPTI